MQKPPLRQQAFTPYLNKYVKELFMPMNNTQLQFQLQTGFVDRLADNDVITQRITDGYINVTAMCKAARKKINDYGRLSTTQAFLSELASVTGISATGLVQIIHGGTPTFRGLEFIRRLQSILPSGFLQDLRY